MLLANGRISRLSQRTIVVPDVVLAPPALLLDGRVLTLAPAIVRLPIRSLTGLALP